MSCNKIPYGTQENGIFKKAKKIEKIFKDSEKLINSFKMKKPFF